jgi:hypothetical protein
MHHCGIEWGWRVWREERQIRVRRARQFKSFLKLEPRNLRCWASFLCSLLTMTAECPPRRPLTMAFALYVQVSVALVL